MNSYSGKNDPVIGNSIASSFTKLYVGKKGLVIVDSGNRISRFSLLNLT